MLKGCPGVLAGSCFRPEIHPVLPAPVVPAQEFLDDVLHSFSIRLSLPHLITGSRMFVRDVCPICWNIIGVIIITRHGRCITCPLQPDRVGYVKIYIILSGGQCVRHLSRRGLTPACSCHPAESAPTGPHHRRLGWARRRTRPKTGARRILARTACPAEGKIGGTLRRDQFLSERTPGAGLCP